MQKGGDVLLEVLEAKGLVPEPTKPSVEPYIQITLGKKISLKTKSIKNTLEPKWQERFEITAKEDVSEVQLQVLDFTRINSADVLGEVRVPLVPGSVDKWFPLLKKKGDKQVPAGEIHLKLTVRVTKRETKSSTTHLPKPGAVAAVAGGTGPKPGTPKGPAQRDIFYFIRENDFAGLCDFLKTAPPGTINSPDTYGYSPLQSACSSKNGDERIIARLLEVPGVDVRTPIKTDQNTALHYFCQNYRSPLDVDDLFHHFIKLGADVNARNSNNETAIFKAIFNNAIKLLLVEKLLEAGADVNIYSHSHGEGVLHYACRLQRADLTMAFLKAGADVKVRGKEGKTPYELALMHPELQQMAQIIQSTEQMVDWLEANGLGAVKKAFQKAELTKDKLPTVKKHMLEEMGIADKELRSKTYKAIKALKKSMKESPDAKPVGPKVMTKEEADSAKALAKILAQLESLKIDRKDWIIDANDLEFTKKLGSGAAGDVFKGLYKNQQVAIKVLKESMEEKELSEFKKELAIISSVKSPHTVYFFGAALGPKKLCMVMELCARGSLCDVMKDKEVQLGWRLGLEFAIETALGLTALHTHQPMIVHRDLKSLNLLVTQDMHVKVCDFGLSRFDTQANDETLHQLRGTMAFCAPEVYHSSKFTPKSDVYSLVLVLWELVNRVIKGFYEAPYSEFKHLQYDFQIIIQVAKKNLRPTIPASCPEPVMSLLKSGMDADPDKRATLAEIVEQLQGFKNAYAAEPASWDGACLPPK